MEKQAELVTIAHKEGEVILLDLWATWCPPCQKPMKHNEEMLAKQKPAWKDKVRLIGLGTDQGPAGADKLCSWIVEKGYEKHVEHYHVANGTCKINDHLGDGGIPHVALLNPKGVIVFKGHPASIDLEKAIDDLLEKGESDLCPAPKGGEAAEPDIENPIDGATAEAIVKEYKEHCKNVIDKHQKDFEKAQRAFFVMEHNQQWSNAKSSMVHGLTVHVVVVGAADTRAAGLTMIKEFTDKADGRFAVRE